MDHKWATGGSSATLIVKLIFMWKISLYLNFMPHINTYTHVMKIKKLGKFYYLHMLMLVGMSDSVTERLHDN